MTSPSTDTRRRKTAHRRGAHARCARSPAESAYSALDKSNRGYLQKNDVESLQGFSFEQADSNSDGRISKEEFTRYWSTKPAK
jgi:Ca2+-binding EF-hand superfamily protein